MKMMCRIFKLPLSSLSGQLTVCVCVCGAMHGQPALALLQGAAQSLFAVCTTKGELVIIAPSGSTLPLYSAVIAATERECRIEDDTKPLLQNQVMFLQIILVWLSILNHPTESH